MSRSIRDYLQDIIEAASAAIEFIRELSFEEFEADKKTTFAVARSLQIIGEAAKKIPDPVRNNYPEIPWKGMAGMRDKVTHEYFGVNLKVVWETIHQDLPLLLDLMPRIIDDLEKGNE